MVIFKGFFRHSTHKNENFVKNFKNMFIYIYNFFIYLYICISRKLQFAAYGQFVLVFITIKSDPRDPDPKHWSSLPTNSNYTAREENSISWLEPLLSSLKLMNSSSAAAGKLKVLLVADPDLDLYHIPDPVSAHPDSKCI